MKFRVTLLLWGLTIFFSLGALALVLLEKNDLAAGFIFGSLILMVTLLSTNRPIESESVTQEEIAKNSISQMDNNFYPGVLPPGSPVDEPESSRDTADKKFRRKTERQHRNLPDKVLDRKPPVIRQQRGMR